MSRHKVDNSLRFDPKDYTAPSGDAAAEKTIEVTQVDPAGGVRRDEQRVPYEPYEASSQLVEAVNVAIALGRPLLLQGDPGCGKTRLAHVLAYAFGLPLETAHIKSTSRAQDLLYTFDAVRRLYDAQLREPGAAAPDARQYVHLGPLGRAIARAAHKSRSVVLIDEIDKADLDFPNDLLWELDRLRFEVAEVPGLAYDAGAQAELRPIIVITHNEEKPLPAAFLRRCVFHYVTFNEDRDYMKRVLELHDRDDGPIGERAVEVLLALRRLDLEKKPGLSELLDWVGYLQAVKATPAELARLPYAGALLKQESDLRRAMEKVPLP